MKKFRKGNVGERATSTAVRIERGRISQNYRPLCPIVQKWDIERRPETGVKVPGKIVATNTEKSVDNGVKVWYSILARTERN